MRPVMTSCRLVTDSPAERTLGLPDGILTDSDIAAALSLDARPAPVDERVVRDRNRMTGGGVTAGIDFALAVAGELFGDAVAQGIQLAIEYHPAPPFQSGSPRTAPAAVLRSVTASGADKLARRRAILERVAQRP